MFINSVTSGLFFANSLSLGSCFNASSRLMFNTSGTILAMASTSRKGISRARPTSRITALVFSFPNVIIWATLSLPPYVSTTYLNTSSLPFMQKSISMSGILLRAGLRKRSKIRPCSIGSRSVIPREYATRLPAADPLPGPTGIPLSLAYRIISATIRKYPGNSMSFITEISFSRRSL